MVIEITKKEENLYYVDRNDKGSRISLVIMDFREDLPKFHIALHTSLHAREILEAVQELYGLVPTDEIVGKYNIEVKFTLEKVNS